MTIIKPILAIFILHMLSCSDERIKKEPQTKNPTIPADAFFVKGKDRGYWCQADVYSHSNNVLIKVYDSRDGKLLLNRRFMVICRLEGNPIWIEDLKTQIDYFDGEKFHLKRPQGKDSCWMQY